MMLYLVIPVALIGCMFLLNIAVTCWEKRMVWPYGEPDALPQVEDEGGYGAKTVAAAQIEGFELIGWVRDLKGPIYKASYGMLVSPGRDTLAIVGIGTILGIRMRTTWLQTTCADRLRWMCSTDHRAGAEPDATGLGKIQLMQGAALGELWRAHQELIGASGMEVLSISENNPLGDYAAVRRGRSEWLSRNGMVRFTDLEGTHWRYTLSGAIRVSLKRELVHVRGMFRRRGK